MSFLKTLNRHCDSLMEYKARAHFARLKSYYMCIAIEDHLWASI